MTGSTTEIKRYYAVHIRYGDSNIRYGEGCEVEMVTALDYDALRAELAEVKAELALALKVPSIAAMHTWLDSECAKKNKQLGDEIAALKAKKGEY